MRNYRRHPRLLQHDFRHPDAVWIMASAPRQIAAMAVVPGEQPPMEMRYVFPLLQVIAHEPLCRPVKVLTASNYKGNEKT